MHAVYAAVSMLRWEEAAGCATTIQNIPGTESCTVHCTSKTWLWHDRRFLRHDMSVITVGCGCTMAESDLDPNPDRSWLLAAKVAGNGMASASTAKILTSHAAASVPGPLMTSDDVAVPAHIVSVLVLRWVLEKSAHDKFAACGLISLTVHW